MKVSLFVDSMMYTENTKQSAEKQLELMSKLSKASEYKINICKLFISLLAILLARAAVYHIYHPIDWVA